MSTYLNGDAILLNNEDEYILNTNDDSYPDDSDYDYNSSSETSIFHEKKQFEEEGHFDREEEDDSDRWKIYRANCLFPLPIDFPIYPKLKKTDFSPLHNNKLEKKKKMIEDDENGFKEQEIGVDVESSFRTYFTDDDDEIMIKKKEKKINDVIDEETVKNAQEIKNVWKTESCKKWKNEMISSKSIDEIMKEEKENKFFILNKKTKNIIKMKEDTRTNTEQGEMNAKKNILCFKKNYGHDDCMFSHSLDEWNPSVCRFNKQCKKANECKFFHNETETKESYLHRSLQIQGSFYNKFSKNLYKLYLSKKI